MIKNQSRNTTKMSAQMYLKQSAKSLNQKLINYPHTINMFKITAILLALTLAGFQGAGEVTGEDLVKLAGEFVDLKSREKTPLSKGYGSIKSIEAEICALQRTIDGENNTRYPDDLKIISCKNSITKRNLEIDKIKKELAKNTERMNEISTQLSGHNDELLEAIKQREDRVLRKDYATDIERQRLNFEIANLKTFIKESNDNSEKTAKSDTKPKAGPTPKSRQKSNKTPTPHLTSGKPL